ncbi:hypothetical protein [Bradyrhizobium sp. LHD-71]|uniref:hypothetical protein n=1 Tax=Bradyrhizobium sp. LHD-71 TaxID=3072141 RepID=UPI00280DEE88|nr:hypothetical protein [Bradyrhizobium sp. LHD-71]MDQ8726236.1 hypothetical protein [Bradyrhizobium sp. LHD-71]
MRRIFVRQRTTQQDLVRLFGERKPKARKPLTDLQAFGVIMSFFVCLSAIGFATFAVLAWLAWERHEFGPNDLRYLVFVRGSLVERIGAIDAEPGTLVYEGQGRDGTAPGFVHAHYTSRVEANALLTRIAERCRSLGLQVKVQDRTSSDGTRYASCGRTPNDEFDVGIGVRAGSLTEVTMGQDVDDG